MQGKASGNPEPASIPAAPAAGFPAMKFEPDFLASLASGQALIKARDMLAPAPSAPIVGKPANAIGFAIKIPAKRRLMAAHSGEFHFATSLAESLRRRGHKVRIDCLNAWSKARVAGEVELLLRGLRPSDDASGNPALIWVLSHGELIAPAELGRADHIFVSSAPFSARLGTREGKVSTLLQCADPNRFSPEMADPKLSCKILFVGNGYPDRLRNGIVGAALRGGHDVSVWGRSWDSIPAAQWKGKLIANCDLGRHYASARVVLNDHHRTMRDAGFVSNRIFDVLACGTPIISDRVAGLPPELADYVYFADTDEELAAAIDSALSESAARRKDRRQFASFIHEHHSFDQRAQVIEAKVLEILANRKDI